MADERIKIMVMGAREKFTDWIANRGGVVRWRNINMSNPDGGDMYTPALDKDRNQTQKPHWGVEFVETIIDISRFQFAVSEKEVKRFRVAVRRSSNGLMLKCTDTSTRKIRKHHIRLEEKNPGKGITYEFDYSTQEAVFKAVTWED